jgi:hypothetical protein
LISRYLSPSPDGKSDEKRIFLMGAIFAFIMLVFLPVSVTPDSRSYIDFAFILTGKPDSSVYFRTPGYPLIMIASGVTLLKSFIGLILVQLAMALYIPIVIYKTLNHINRKAGYLAAEISIFSLTPYLYMKAILTEQSYIFVLLLSIYAAAKYFHTKNVKYVYFISIALAVAILIRPSSSLIFFIFFSLTTLFVPRKALHSIAAAIIVVASIALWAFLRPIVLNMPESRGSTANVTGRALFYNAFLFSAGNMKKSNGPGTAELIDTLDKYLRNNQSAPDVFLAKTADRSDEFKRYFYGRFKGDPAGLVREMFDHPSFTYETFIWEVADKAVGPEKSDRLQLSASLEFLKKHPGTGVRFFLENLAGFTISQPLHPNHDLDLDVRVGVLTPRIDILTFEGITYYMDGLPPHLLKEAGFDPLGKILVPLRRLATKILGIFFFDFRPLIFFFMLLGVICLFRTSDGRPIAALCFLIIAYNALATSVFAVPVPRLINHTILVEIMMASIVMEFLIERLRQTDSR